MAKTGLEIIKALDTTAGEIAEIISKGHPPFEEDKVPRSLTLVVWGNGILKGKGHRKPCSLKRAFCWSFSIHAKEKRNR